MKRKSYVTLVMMGSVPLLMALSFFGVSYLHTSKPLVVRTVGGDVDGGVTSGGCPTGFGKTHFIVGQTPEQRAQVPVCKKGKVKDTQRQSAAALGNETDRKQGSVQSGDQVGQKQADFPKNKGGRKQAASSKTQLGRKQAAADLAQLAQDQESISVSLAQPAVFFSPDDNVRAYLLDLIAHEQEHIAIAVFVFTDKHIAQALIEAHERGVLVELVTDTTGLRDRYNKVSSLCDVSIPVFVYDTQNGKAGSTSVMHHKFVVFKKNKNNKSCVWTGSCNCTKSAYESNQENAILLIDNAHVEQFSRQFNILKTRSYRYKK